VKNIEVSKKINKPFSETAQVSIAKFFFGPESSAVEVYNPIYRESRVPQLQGAQRRSCSQLPQALGNAEDEVASAFPKGKQRKYFFTIIHQWLAY
jgi:hypothetical protein